jgi:hypothetical protein
MAVFDQRGQQVVTQYNIAGDFNFGAAKNKTDVAEQLEKLSAEVSRAIAANIFADDTATDLEYNMKKAIQQARKPESNQATVLEHLNTVKELTTTATAASGLVTAIGQAVEMVQKFLK